MRIFRKSGSTATGGRNQRPAKQGPATSHRKVRLGTTLHNAEPKGHSVTPGVREPGPDVMDLDAPLIERVMRAVRKNELDEIPKLIKEDLLRVPDGDRNERFHRLVASLVDSGRVKEACICIWSREEVLSRKATLAARLITIATYVRMHSKARIALKEQLLMFMGERAEQSRDLTVIEAVLAQIDDDYWTSRLTGMRVELLSETTAHAATGS
ncbi:hypothetical protein FJZ48_04135 [Candidatus Uhrbacteria bacterium]|nr:hypothetical protein [Candidatus Uhrbacteria bacterium]